MDTVPSAKYAKVDSASWKKLKTRAASLAQDHELAAYAVSLISTTDAGLLKKAMPQASEVSADEVGTRFAQVAGDLVRLQAAKALKDELAAPDQGHLHRRPRRGPRGRHHRAPATGDHLAASRTYPSFSAT